MNNGFIFLHRKLLDNPIINKPFYCHLWITILLMASHRPNRFIWNGEEKLIDTGQFITGRKELSRKTGIPESTVEDILKFLEKQHQIRQQKTNKFRLISVVNYCKYQKPDSKSNNKPTTKQQQADTINNDNNDNNGNKAHPIKKLPFILQLKDGTVARNKWDVWVDNDCGAALGYEYQKEIKELLKEYK
jgi:hypothetical protein